MRIPIFGWYAWKAGMIVIDREGGAKALRNMLGASRASAWQDVRQLVIFPEGHRGEPGVAGDYQPGVAGLYRDLEPADATRSPPIPASTGRRTASSASPGRSSSNTCRRSRPA